MKLVMTLRVGEQPDVLDAHVSYHLNAGVDLVVVAADAMTDETSAVFDSYVRDGHARVVPEDANRPDDERRTALVGVAVEESADWVIDSDLHEFWWPRAENLKDALVAIPPRYTVVQALVRRFLPADGDGPRTLRRQLGSPVHGPLALGDWLRPVYRASPGLTPVRRGAVAEPWRVPLRAWYPIEVFDFSSGEGAESGTDHSGTDDVVSDTRLVDALARLRSTGVLSIPVPDIVDDASYAVECAALGEADFGPIETHIEELEQRIAALEAQFWPSVQRALRRLVPRRR